jgi:threonine/homoserine/homoserine lactone efflux protein
VTVAGLLLFLAAYATAAALPGPGLAALIARVLARGLRGVSAYILGFVAGDLIWFTAAATGLAAIAAAFQPLLTLIRFAGAAYLLYLAFKLVTAPPQPFPEDETQRIARPLGDFAAGLALTLGNPKVIVFFLALLPSVVDFHKLDAATGIGLAACMAITLASILGAYALVAARARRLFRSRKAMRALNVGTGTVMAGAAVAIATK